MKERITNAQVKEFYKDTKAYLPVTSAYMKTKYGQDRGGYISFAKLCSSKGKFDNPDKVTLEDKIQLANYEKIKKSLNSKNDDTYDLKFLNEIKDISILDIDMSTSDIEPNQKWHLYVSLFAQSVVGDSKFKWQNHFKKYPCLQLKLWMAEGAGIDVKNISDAIKNNMGKREVNSMIKNIEWNEIFEIIDANTCELI